MRGHSQIGKPVFLRDKPGEQPYGWAGLPAQTYGYSTGNGQGAAELRAGPGEQPYGWAGLPAQTYGYSTGNGQGAAELRAGPGEQPYGWAGLPAQTFIAVSALLFPLHTTESPTISGPPLSFLPAFRLSEGTEAPPVRLRKTASVRRGRT